MSRMVQHEPFQPSDALVDIFLRVVPKGEVDLRSTPAWYSLVPGVRKAVMAKRARTFLTDFGYEILGTWASDLEFERSLEAVVVPTSGRLAKPLQSIVVKALSLDLQDASTFLELLALDLERAAKAGGMREAWGELVMRDVPTLIVEPHLSGMALARVVNPPTSKVTWDGE